VISLVAMATIAGCATPASWPVMVVDGSRAKEPLLPRLEMPIDGPFDNRRVPDVVLSTPEPPAHDAPAWSARPRDAFEPQEVREVRVVHRLPEDGISPYHGGEFAIVQRLVARTSDGRWWFTAPVDEPSADLDATGLYVPVATFDLSSPHGELRVDGVLVARRIDPLEAAATGYRMRIGVRGSEVATELHARPDFASIASIDFTPARGASGTPGRGGTPGRDGEAGRPGFAGAAGAAGHRGPTGGNGGAGGDGTDGQLGGDGKDAGPRGQGGDADDAGDGGDGARGPRLEVAVAPLESRFAAKSLVRIDIRKGDTDDDGGDGRRTVVVPQHHAFAVVARGGDGGPGGKGGDGGRGGAGGDGGVGGDGGDGGRGGPGGKGQDGAAGSDATSSSSATQGGDGEPGGSGGHGGCGGNGSIGGNAGNGWHGGDGANGGNGGHGGDGGSVVVEIAGDAAFRDAVRASLTYDVRGGAEGPQGARGEAGPAGRAGIGGRAGRAGEGGSGGPGGQGGDGGRGGSGCSWEETDYVTDSDGETHAVSTSHSRPGASDGRSGRAGFEGPTGSSGHAGKRGRDGLPGQPGRPGRPGVPGRTGKAGSVTIRSAQRAGD